MDTQRLLRNAFGIYPCFEVSCSNCMNTSRVPWILLTVKTEEGKKLARYKFSDLRDAVKFWNDNHNNFEL